METVPIDPSRSEARPDPGLEGVVPFEFACHRCGHCCTGGAGQVWVEEDEVEELARAAGLEADAFRRLHLRTVHDPRTGRPRLSVRERDESDGHGACGLLEGANHCSVYASRPRHCQTFPYWPEVLSDEGAFARAQATCPGIRVEVSEATRREAFERLERLYAELDAFLVRARPVCIQRGVCCRFEDAGHELFATGLEADYCVAQHSEAPAPEAPGRCPYHVSGRCTAREGRPLGCRTYFCDVNTESVLQEAHEHTLRAVRDIEAELGYPKSYARFPGLVQARGVGLGDGGAS